MRTNRLVPLALALLVAASVSVAQTPERRTVALISGYPAFDSPIVKYLFRHAGAKVTEFEQQWLDTREYAAYDIVVISGDLVRAKMEPNRFTPDDLKNVKAFLEKGGTLLLLRGGLGPFAGPEGQFFLQEILGSAPRERQPKLEILKRDHPWLKHLSADKPHPWAATGSPVAAGKAERLIGSTTGYATLVRASVGKGALIYVGWEIAQSIPHGRLASSVEAENNFDEQMKVLTAIINDICPPRQVR